MASHPIPFPIPISLQALANLQASTEEDMADDRKLPSPTASFSWAASAARLSARSPERRAIPIGGEEFDEGGHVTGAGATTSTETREERGVPAVRRMERTREDVDRSAEEFIRRFRENLLLQRKQSIENYQQMLARGA
ncbi:hypothetical protein AXF42_Ash002989 [Apostasia shenzhenica]|uniref:DUF761 domain-containing protein n=1 Tax=Apostasia shenzhenica TaxID=1088818 RepID=A0A2I0A7U8_9ASPA|nr:hypothetical protein AXF42_Ash002989 [Apostasia shenzhenica]